MTSSTKHSIIKGTFILTIAGIAARFLGFYNRIFLTDLFGARELGIYQMIFPVYMVIFSFCCQGIQTALTRQVARPDFDSGQSKVCLLRSALSISVFLSLLSCAVIYCNAEWISLQLLHSKECTHCLRILCLAFPFVSIKGCITGYYIGIQKSGVTAWGQLIEQIAKIGGVYLLSTLILTAPPQAYFAVYGIVAGEIVSCLWAVSCYIRDRLRMHLPADKCAPAIHYRQELLRDALPLTANRLSLTVLQCLEAILIPHMLNLYFCNGDQSLILYGTLTGMVLPCIMFPTTVTSSLATMLLPAISSEYQKDHKESLQRLIQKSIRFCLLIGAASTFFLLFLGNWTGQFLFQSETAGTLLFQFALLCPFIYLSACLSSIVNGMGFAALNLLYSILGIGIRIAFILTLVPRIGLTGYMWGMMFSYLLQTGLLLISIRKKSLP
ncbi:MAG: polysaccharide biosynthesis protein [Clostridium sp.]|nr:polysaccharide biosynthesis protein [Clostridium sp.]